MILIVDDSPDLCALLAQVLGAGGFSAACVGGGQEALAYLNHSRPELVLLDISMPGMNGLEVLEAMRASPARGVPVVMITAHDDAESRLRAAELGARAFLVNGATDVDQILACIQKNAATH